MLSSNCHLELFTLLGFYQNSHHLADKRKNRPEPQGGLKTSFEYFELISI
jgi:hypothetical protein